MRQMGWELAPQSFDSREEAETYRQGWREIYRSDGGSHLDAETEQRLVQHFGRPLTDQERRAFALAEKVCGKMALPRDDPGNH